jgi:acyl dehydratase
MPINPDAVGATSEPTERSWNSKDCLLYALGVGAGALDATGFELEFTTENSAGVTQAVLPTFAAILGQGGAPLSSIGSFNPAMLVHGEQAITLNGPIPTAGTVRTTSTVSGVYDKGSGALVVIDAESVDPATGTQVLSTQSALFIRGEGGFGGERGPKGAGLEPVEGEPDEVVTYSTREDQALLYRLSGDRNPLHSDPTFAKAAGFDRPILHGLCTYGFTGRALLHTVCGSDPARFNSMRARFSKPTMPGDTLTVSIWVSGNTARFRTDNARGETVLDGGVLEFS